MFLKKAVESVRALLLFIHKMENQHLNWLDAVCACVQYLEYCTKYYVVTK